MKLHLGAFDQSVNGWINTDITPHIIISKIPFLPYLMFKIGLLSIGRYKQHSDGIFRSLKYVDLTKKLPFRNNTVEAIFSSHVFEHLFIDEVEVLISECYRVLKPNGIMRIVVPDLEKIIASYDKSNPCEFINQIYEAGSRSSVKNSHHCAFTGNFLMSLCEKAGYKKCTIQRYLVGDCPDIEQLDNRPESLFFEAVK